MLPQALPVRQVATETVEDACEDAIWARTKEGRRIYGRRSGYNKLADP